jgi:hypothetical protein
MANRVGRRPFVPTEDQRNLVMTLHAHGIAQATIARQVYRRVDLDAGGKPREGAKPIDADTLRKAFRRELDCAHEQVKASMIQVIVAAAEAGCWGAARYWLMTHGGPEWRLTERHTLAGDPVHPLRVTTRQVGSMTDEEIEAELRALDEQEQAAAELQVMAATLPSRH